MSLDKLNNITLFYNGISSRFSYNLAYALINNGARLFITDTDSELLEKFRTELGNKIGNSVICSMSEGSAYQIESVISRCFEGMKTFTCAVNNYVLPESGLNLHDCTIDYWNSVFRTNMSGIFSFLKYELSLMVGFEKGCIINTFNPQLKSAAEQNHIVFTLLKAVTGLTEITAQTYGKNNIKIFSFYPDIKNLLPVENTINRRFNESVHPGESINEIIELIGTYV